MLNGYLFSLVAMGTGIDRWRLTQAEGEQLGAVMADCARALPGKKMKAVEQLLGTVAPWIGLVGTAAVIMIPRVQHHRYIRAVQAGHIKPGAGEHDNLAEGGRNDGHSATGAGQPIAASGEAAPSGAHGVRDDAQGSTASASDSTGISDTSRAILGVL